MKPLIGITCGILHDQTWHPPFIGHRQTYVDAIVRAGGAPVLIPPASDEAALRAVFEHLDGLLLAGGGDVAPSHYGETPHAKLGPVAPLRDDAELAMARWAVAEGKPLFGVCRGIQVLNVALGGTLYQDIPSQIDGALAHDRSYERKDWSFLAHEIRLAPDSRLCRWLGVERLMVNSLHHQAVRKVAPGLRAVAWSADGVIEAVEGVDERFIVGVQCHPEALQDSADPRWRRVFAAFVQHCLARQIAGRPITSSTKAI